jgi:fructose-bisphosphate aldolase / 2-amino-3,7-dideoxy-D-threo-hept-6-ulosonate synthase
MREEDNSIMSAITGKKIRLNRLIQTETNTCLICAIDHGMTSPIFLDGLYDTGARVKEAITGGANVLMLGRGVVKTYAHHFQRDTSLALMLTASSAGRPGGAMITPIGSVEEALRIGADAVVVYVALAGDNEPDAISYVSKVGETCEYLGMPLIAEAEYPNAYQSLNDMQSALGVDYLKRNARLCAELGADIVKVNWSGDQKSFGEIIRACDRPVVLAGGTLISDEELLVRMAQARDVGAVGCSIGRNIFQHKNPQAMTEAISRIFRDKWKATQALDELSAKVN